MSNHLLAALVAGLWSSTASLDVPSTIQLADEGGAVVQPEEPPVWTVPCSVGAGTRLTAWTDRTLGTDSSHAGEPFAARVTTRVRTSCGSDFISAGALVRGRVARAEPGAPPVLALELTDADTSVGPRPIAAAIRAGAGLEWIQLNTGDPRASYKEFVLYPSWSFAQSRSTTDGRVLQLTLPAGTLIEVELIEPVLILP
jgi:hypothetical protein